MMVRGKNKGRQGFTLIELLVVIVLIAIVAALTLPALQRMYRGQSAWAAQQVLQGVFTQARADAIANDTHTFVSFLRPRWPWLERQDQWVSLLVRLKEDDNGNPMKATLVDRGTIFPVDVGMEGKICATAKHVSLPASVDYNKSKAVDTADSLLIFDKDMMLTAPGYLLCALTPPEDWPLPTSWDPDANHFEDHYVCLVRYEEVVADGVKNWRAVERTGVKNPTASKLVDADWVKAIQNGGHVYCVPIAFGPSGQIDYIDNNVILIRFSLFFKANSAAEADDVNVLGVWPLTGEIRYIKPLS